MLRRLLILPLAALAAFFLATPVSTSLAAAPQFPTGLRVGLELPPGLVPSRRFPGFEDPGHKVLVAIFQLPGQAYEHILKAGFDKHTHGMTHVSKAAFAVAGGEGYLVDGETKINDRDAHRWFLLAKPKDDGNDGDKASDKNADTDDDKGPPISSLIRVDVPDDARDVYSDAVVRKMLASVDFRPPPIQEQLGLLPFELKDLAGFRVARVVPGGAVLTDGPSDQIGKADQPYIIVSVGRGGPRDPALRGNFARDVLRSGPLSNVRVTSADTIRIGRSRAYELRAMAKDPTGQEIMAVQWLRFGPGGYMRIIGVTPKDDWDTLFHRFRAVRDGVTAR